MVSVLQSGAMRSWSWHQKYERGFSGNARGLGTNTISYCSLSLLANIPLLGATRGILVMAPELQEDLLGTKVKRVTLTLVIYIF